MRLLVREAVMTEKWSRFSAILAGILVFGGLSTGNADAAGSCTSIPGVWSWFVNGDVTFKSNGTLTQGPRTGRWTCSNGIVTIVWSHGYTDRVTLSSDGRKMTGTNEYGNAISGARRSSGGGGGTEKPAMVFENCQVTPCMIGVADPSYAVPGNQRYAEGWRRFNTNPYPLTNFPNDRKAWQFACRIHYSSSRHNSPDIEAGRVNCAELCGGNPRCP